MHYRHAWQGVTIEDALETADIFVTTTGNRDIITAERILKQNEDRTVLQYCHLVKSSC